MIFFSERKLATRLRTDEVTRNQLLVYSAIFLGYFLYSYISALMALLEPYARELRSAGIAMHVISQALNLMLVFYAYRVNSKGDGKKFVARYICLAIPIGIKALGLAILMILPSIHYAYVHFVRERPNWISESGMSGPDNAELFKQMFGPGFFVYVSSVQVILTLFWAWRMKIVLRIASGQTKIRDSLH